MKRISDFAQKIRDFVNNNNLYDKYFKKYPDQWSTLCVAMDTLEDSSLAMEHYETSGIGEENGEKYLKLYGLLQAIFLQQDSIRYLYKIFVGSDLLPGSTWRRIRELRNLTVGHPIEKKDKTSTKRCSIARISISSNGFMLMLWNKDENKIEFEDVDLKSLYNLYKSEVARHLESIHNAQVKEWVTS